MGYTGYVRVIDANENILDVVEASLGEIEHDGHSWGGTLSVAAGGSLEGKTMPVDLAVPGLFRASILLLPGPTADGISKMAVLGNGANPFED